MNKEKMQLRSTALRRGNKAGTGLLLSLLSLSLAAAPLAAYAGPDATASAVMQDGHVMVKGRIVDANGEAIIGANVVEEGTANGTITDFDGYFSLKVAQGARLVISYVGYTSQTVDAKPDMKITLREDSELLGEVVVTALGIEKKESSLTYATQKVDGAELTRAKDANFINALQGKTAGLVITPNATGAGGSSKIILRGNKSILGNNQALIVIDGVPMVDSQRGTQIGDALLSGGNTTDSGDPLSNINPDDIESITVLKGSNAAALYGSDAGNGVIVITTKKGAEGKVSVSVSSSTLFEKALVLPELQNDYGASVEYFEDTSLNPNSPTRRRRLSLMSWGPKIGNLSQATLDEIPYARNYAVDNIGDFYQLGTNFNNSVAVSGGNKTAQTYFSYGNTTSNGIIDGNKFLRHNLTFRETMNLFDDHLQISASGSYIHQKVNNRPGSGAYANPIYSLYLMPRNADINYFRDNYETNGMIYYHKLYDNETTYRSTNTEGPIQYWPWIASDNQNNPYWYQHRLLKEQVTERIYGMVAAKVKIIPELSVDLRFRADRTNYSNDEKTYDGTKSTFINNSIYSVANSRTDQIYADFLINYTDKFGDFDISANFGGSTWKEDYYTTGFTYWMADSTHTPNVFSPSNINTAHSGAGLTANESVDQNWKNSIYGTASIGYKDMAYIDGSFRTDWARAFSQFYQINILNSKHYTYYAVGGNMFIDKVFGIEKDWLHSFKLRVSYSDVGIPIPNQFFNMVGINYANGSLTASQYRNFKKAEPERNRSTEVGFDLSLFRRALDIEFTFYNNMSLNQWLPTDAATGGKLPEMAGKIRNRGVETTVTYTLTPNNNFNWRTSVNYSFNQNEILQLFEGKDTYSTTPVFQGGLQLRYEKGKPIGELYGKTFEYEEDGKTIKVDRTGAPKISPDYSCYLGNANAKHHLSWSNNFNYKNFNLYFLIDGKIGGTVVSYTEARLDMYGVSKRSGDARNSGVTYLQKSFAGDEIVLTPVAGVVMPDGNVAPAQGYFQAIGGGEPCLSQYAYSATNFRLRELSLGYTFRSLFGEGKDLSVSAVARNLFFFYKDAPVDPDISVSTTNGYGGLDAFSTPTTRSFGINLKATF